LLDRVECAAAALRRIECVPLRIVRRHVEQGLYRWQHWLRSAVEREQLARHLLPYSPRVVLGIDLEVAVEKLDDGKIRGSLAVGDRGAFENQPALQVERMGELLEET